MDSGIYAARMQLAREALVAAARAAAATGNLPGELALGLEKANHRDANLRALFELEALVPVVQALGDQAPSGPSVDDVLALEGLSKTSRSLIEKAFGDGDPIQQ